MSDGVVTFLVTHDAKIWLAERLPWKPALPYPHSFASPGGHVEQTDESFRDAARREVIEETGLELFRGRFVEIGTSFHPRLEDPTVQYQMHWFGVRLRSNEIPQRTEPIKQGAWLEYERSNLPWPMPPGNESMLWRLSKDWKLR